MSPGTWRKLLTIIDYGLGNLRSVAKALEFLGVKAKVSSSAEDIRSCGGLILPGVGAFGDGMRNLRRLGLSEVLTEEVLDEKKPILGICLGMQLFAETGFEGGVHEGLGWIHADVRKLDVKAGLKLPHVGWNDVSVVDGGPLFAGVGDKPAFYFVHSYHVACNPELVSSTCEYGEVFAASLQSGDIFGVQFHPEKSQRDGLSVLKNFADYCGRRPC
jgi:glutamine amidotransferase